MKISVKNKLIPSISIILVLLALVLSLCRLSWVSNIDSDEVEHAHITWLLRQGVMPYSDIHQLHMPGLWLLASPIFSFLPKSALSFFILRSLCLAALAGSCILGLLFLKEVYPSVTRNHFYSFLFLVLTSAGAFQFYRFRPDPFMTLFTTWAIYFVLKLRHNEKLFAFLAGVGFGLAASFSPKMFPLCFLVPLLSLLEAIRCRNWRPLLVVFPHGLGFVVGLSPMLAWVSYKGLFKDFVQWAIVHNSHFLRSFGWTVAPYLEAGLYIVFCIFGAYVLFKELRKREKSAWSIVNCLIIATILSWIIQLSDPNHLAYNLEAFTIPSAVLGAFALVWLVQKKGFIIAGIVLVLFLIRPVFFEGVLLQVPGLHVHRDDMSGLISLARSDNTTCVAFAPFHPVFCHDATNLYLSWDLFFLNMPWVSEDAKKIYRKMWSQAAEVILDKKPDIIVNPSLWFVALQAKAITYKQFTDITAFLASHYITTHINTITICLRKGFKSTKNIKEVSHGY